MAGEILALRLLTLHNVHFYLELVRTAREYIKTGDFIEWKRGVVESLSGTMVKEEE